MPESPRQHPFKVEATGASSGKCDCCGLESRCVWGLVHDDDAARAAYWMQWTAGHMSDHGANLDLILGAWGEGTTADDRFAVALVHRQQADGSPALAFIDAEQRPIAALPLAKIALARKDVIGTPLAEQIFAITDAIYAQDDRFF